MPDLLWIEDEPDQLSAARGELEDRDWRVTFARDIASAATLLSTTRYDALIMDLMVAGNDGVAKGFAIWSTYRLLCWLGDTRPDARAGISDQWKGIDQLAPVADNRRIPAMILSAYHWPEVTAAMGAVNLARVGVEIRFFSKPIDEVRVARELLAVVAEGKPA